MKSTNVEKPIHCNTCIHLNVCSVRKSLSAIFNDNKWMFQNQTYYEPLLKTMAENCTQFKRSEQ